VQWHYFLGFTNQHKQAVMKQNQERPGTTTGRSHNQGGKQNSEQPTGTRVRQDTERENPDHAESGASPEEGGLGEQTEKEGGLGRKIFQPPVE
jgi:hypothetical protein